MSMRSKILGMLIGGAVGDALGMAVETWTPEKILEVHPNGITGYVEPIGHKWFTPETMPAGITTDDTQLTVATMKGLIAGKAKTFDSYMDAIGVAHVMAMEESTAGWGTSTKDAVRRLKNGCHWSKSGMTNEPHRGTGNGIPMKCAALAAWYAAEGASFEEFDEADMCSGRPSFNQRLVDYAAMTHYNQISGHACVMHTHAVGFCLWTDPDKFDSFGFTDTFDVVFDWAKEKDGGVEYTVEHLVPNEDLLEDQARKLIKHHKDFPTMTRDQIVELFGIGSCYVYESLPFSYAYFLKNPHSLTALREVVEAGGDTDTNAKMVGELIGALHGIEFFEKSEHVWTLEGLKGYDELRALGNLFCDTFGVP